MKEIIALPMTVSMLMRVFIPFALGYFLSYLYRTVNAVIAPDLVADIGLDPASLGLLTSAYFLTFAAAQLPLGILLDRYGSRRVEGSLLLIAAVGALVFALAQNVALLLAGRALIGLGVSACLMAAFKAFSTWFPPERLPLANAVQMVSGGIGALTATAPVEAALQVTDWRGIFMILAVLTFAAALLIFLAVPEAGGNQRVESLKEQVEGIRTIYSSAVFWRIAPLSILTQASAMAIGGLWAGPWLHDVTGYGRTRVAETLLLIAFSMIVGYISLGAIADRLRRRGIPPQTVAVTGQFLFMAVQFLLILQWVPLVIPLWMLFGFFGTSGVLTYAVLSQAFPLHLAGRANTALNLPVFIAAFAIQWAIGAVIGLWPEMADGGYDPAGYQAGIGIFLGLQVLAGAWFWYAGRIRSSAR